MTREHQAHHKLVLIDQSQLRQRRRKLQASYVQPFALPLME